MFPKLKLIVLDFSMALDEVLYQRLLYKLKIYFFLTTRTQKVVVDGRFSHYAHVGFSVLQRTVLRLISSFMLH